MRELAQRIASADYVVDVDAVTRAILRRLDVDEAFVSPASADGRPAPEGRSRPTG